MSVSDGSRVVELFGRRADGSEACWRDLIRRQHCPFTNAKCYKVRKSQAEISIGTCVVRHGVPTRVKDIIICPKRLLERHQVFTDCLHLLTQHQPGNELHVVPEISVPGGSVDYFLVSAKNRRARDFVAIEFQTLDTTGTVWPERQRLLRRLGIKVADADVRSEKKFGMNWKMTAKTILVQLHHKVSTFEQIGKRFVLVVQDCLLGYLQSQFNFDHLGDACVGDTMHIHAYCLEPGSSLRVRLASRISTDAAGIAECLNIQAETRLELEGMLDQLNRKLSDSTRLEIGRTTPR